MIQKIAARIPSISRHTIRTLALILFIIASLSFSSAAIVQGLEVEMVWPVGFLALAVGWLLARSRMSGWLVSVIGMLGGFGLVFWRVGRLSGPFVKLLQVLFDYLSLAVRERAFPDSGAIQFAWQGIILGIQVLFNRLYFWVVSMFGDDPSLDPIVLVMVWSITIWGLVMWMSWAIRRRDQPFTGAVPAFLVLGYSLAFVGGNAFYLLPIMGSVLLLGIFVGHDTRERDWKLAGEKFPQKLRRNVAWTAMIISVALVTMAAFAPSISLEDINDFYDRLTQNQESQIEESLGLEQGSNRSAFTGIQSAALNDARAGGLPRQHLIGSGPELSDQVVMVISATELQPELAGGVIEVPKSPDGYYWRSLTYDRFDGRGWGTFDLEMQQYQPGQLAFTSSLPGQRLLRQQVSLAEDNPGLLLVAGNLIRSDQTFIAGWRSSESGAPTQDLFGVTIDVSTYVADSLLQEFSSEELRSTGQNYPTSISEKYLDLPDVISERVISLAFDLTATQPTAYERAIAIETYLRTFEYDLDIPPPPLGLNIDIADYFLFTLQRGYCDYYATSMVVLARAAGLPARFVVGYIGGTYDPELDVYIITEDQAHSWVEIYFPEYGWVEFEPTAGRPAIERPAESLPEIPPEFEVEAGFLQPFEDLLPPLIQPRENLLALWLQVGQYALIAIVVFLIVWPFVEIYRLWFFAPSMVVSNVYARIYRYGGHLDIPARREKTPHEFAEVFAERFSELLHRRRPAEFLQTARENIDWLTGQFAHFRYGRNQPGRDVKKRAIQMWLQLRSAMWAARWEAWRSRFRRVEEDEEE